MRVSSCLDANALVRTMLWTNRNVCRDLRYLGLLRGQAQTDDVLFGKETVK